MVLIQSIDLEPRTNHFDDRKQYNSWRCHFLIWATYESHSNLCLNFSYSALIIFTIARKACFSQAQSQFSCILGIFHGVLLFWYRRTRWLHLPIGGVTASLTFNDHQPPLYFNWLIVFGICRWVSFFKEQLLRRDLLQLIAIWSLFTLILSSKNQIVIFEFPLPRVSSSISK
jgi:hypothetical protein